MAGKADNKPACLSLSSATQTSDRVRSNPAGRKSRSESRLWFFFWDS